MEAKYGGSSGYALSPLAASLHKLSEFLKHEAMRVSFDGDQISPQDFSLLKRQIERDLHAIEREVWDRVNVARKVRQTQTVDERLRNQYKDEEGPYGFDESQEFQNNMKRVNRKE